ncbi:MAG: hypothetical protein E6490_10280, partial [Bifidobacterium longum]|nr:hypothetical protein [Bifidobacterium longum]
GRSGESTMHASSTTMPLTLRSRLHMPSIRRFAVVVSLGRKHPTQKALFTYSHNNSTTNPHPQKQQ